MSTEPYVRQQASVCCHALDLFRSAGVPEAVAPCAARSARLGRHTFISQADANDLAVDNMHPHVVNPGAFGLPKGCLTYSQRYDGYKNFIQLQ